MKTYFTILISLLVFFSISSPAESWIFPQTSVSPTSGYAPLEVTFTATCEEVTTSWLWNFGDGTSSTWSTLKDTSHIYTQPGSYRPSIAWKSSLTGGAGEGSVSPSSSGLIVVFPTADFSASPTSGNAPLTVEFKDTSTGSPISWTWNFGDGISSYEQNPVHTYSAAGTYSVIMSVRYNSGTEIKTRNINVLKSTPTITWNNPADIRDKTALSGTQLNAVASVPGTFVYTPPAGTILNAGTQTLKVDFTPSDTANYNSASKTVAINVLSNNGNGKDNTNNGNHGNGNNGNH